MRLILAVAPLLSIVVAGACWAQEGRASAPGPAPEPEPERVDDVLVTGSLIPRLNAISPVEILTRRAIERQGVLEASGWPNLSPANSGSEWQVDQLNQPQTSGTSQFNLRNLGLGSTLVLVDGRRHTVSAVAATDGSTFVDISSLVPRIVLGRIELLKDGASATYGSDAVAGVVNVVTRRRIDRSELRTEYALADGSEAWIAEGITGGAWLGGDVVLAGSAFRRTSLGSDDRRFTQAATYDFAPWSAVTSYGQPGSYFRPSLGRFVPDPDCDDPAFDKASRLSSTDTFCRLDYSDFFDLVPEEDRSQLYASWRGRVAPGVGLTLQAGWGLTGTIVRQSPSLPILAGALTVPASHPDNPFAEDVLFRGRLLGAEAGASHATFDYDTRRLVGALDGAWSNGWIWSLAGAFSRQTVAYDKPDVIRTALQAALRGLGGGGCDPLSGRPGLGGCQYFNPFGSAQLGTGGANSAQLIGDLTGSTGLRGRSSLGTLDALVSGPAAGGAWGSLDLALGLQARRAGFGQDWSALANAGELLTAGVSPDFSATQGATAMFAEARLSLSDRLDVQLGGRFEREAGEGSLSPKVGFAFRADETLTLRASYSGGFRSPPLFVRRGAQASQPSVFDRGAFVFVNTVTVGTPDLKPERSRSWALGTVWNPLEGLSVAVDGWRFVYTDLIVKAPVQALIDQARADDLAGRSGTPAQQRVMRDPTGALSRVDIDYLNAAGIETQGVDVTVRLERPIGGGQLTASTLWTYVDRYAVRLSPGVPAVSGAGSTNLSNIGRSLPRTRGEAQIGWIQDGWSISALAHYVSDYRNDRSGVANPEISAWLTFGVVGEVELADGVTVSAGVRNIADRDPPLVQFALGYDPVVADPRGQILSVRLSKRF